MNKNMNAEENKGSAGAGSPEELIKGDPEAQAAGQSQEKKEVDLNNYVPKKQYDELESKLGTQGKDLGDLRTFFKEVSPLLDKLQASPEVVEAILDGKIDSKLAQAVMDGKVKVEDATTVAQAQIEVKKELGKKEYDKMSVGDIEKLVEVKAREIIDKELGGLRKKVDEGEESRDFEDGVNAFVKNTPDIAKYAEGMNKWWKDHPDQYDIEVAYNTVKGKALAEKYSKEEEAAAVEEAKNLAANAGGGGSQGGNISAEEDIVDKLISSKRNPNVL